ncbi:hypothetical protein D6789_04650 [Candidatus Woesearchaeota archaeon]|nr:MAG: hypothetical protein D6789_04650 [Candidatus Woesearchaeota archaeon]
MNKNKQGFFGVLLIALVTLSAQSALAAITLDGVSTDPSVIAAGDEVTLTVTFHESGESTYIKANDGSYSVVATLEPGDTVTREKVTILDGIGAAGHLFIDQAWSKNYRIKVHDDAPVGTYQFKLRFQYFKDGRPVESPMVEYFTLSVTKEGIIINVANIVTTPSEVRPGDNYVVLETALENSGRKDAKSVEYTLTLPDGFSAPYANNNRVWAGYLAAGEEQALTTYFSVAEDTPPGVYTFTAHLNYRDVDDNRYAKTITFPVLVREKPVIVVTKSEGELLAGSSGELRVTLKNIGSETAENVDARLLKASSQPFALDARSDFVGTLAPGEEATAVFPLEAESSAAVKEHSFTLLVRAKGDSNKGDDNIYTYSREATVSVTGKAPNIRLWLGVTLLLIVILVIAVAKWRSR